MALFHFENKGNYRYGIWKMDESEDELRNILGDQISAPFKNSGKRVEFLSVRALALQMNVNPLSITHLPSGKPLLTGSCTTISISHTKGFVAIMLSESPYIGTDIEYISERVLKVRKKFMSDFEENALKKHSENETILLLLHWSAKESIFKAIPDEGVDFISELRIMESFPLADKGSFKAIAVRSGMEFQVDYLVDTNFVFTSCFPL